MGTVHSLGVESSELGQFFDFIYGDETGYAYSPTKNPVTDAFEQYFFSWPAERELLLQHVRRYSATHEVYYSPALDCTDEHAAARAFAGYDIVLNSAMIRGHYIKTTRAALAAGAHYLDMTSLGEEPLQFALHEEFAHQQRTCVLDMGTAPGLSNLMAVYCMEKLDRTESIDYAWGVIDTVPAHEHTRPLYWGYGFDGIMGLISGPSIVYEEGEVRQLPPRARPETFHFKTGPQQIKGMPHREPIMLSESFPEAGLEHIMYRQAFDADSEALPGL